MCVTAVSGSVHAEHSSVGPSVPSGNQIMGTEGPTGTDGGVY